MLYIVLTTGKCNLKCRYCGGSFEPEFVPWKVSYPVSKLKKLVKPGDIICFYGGEPLLNLEFIREVMDSVEATYVIQTNGTLVHELEEEYWKRFDTVLLSVDGVKEVTDYYRGKGIYDKVMSAREFLKGKVRDLVARMALSERGDVYRDVKHLLPLFDHVHWQLDVVWSERWENFSEWKERYKEGIEKLAEFWIREMEKGKVWGIAPFQGILRVEYGVENLTPPCEAGVNSVAILPNGKVISCPIAVREKWATLGTIDSFRTECGIGEPCTSCPYLKYCGGRCLYAYKERYWGEEGFKQVCEITKHTINVLLNIKPRIDELIKKGALSKKELIYPEYNNSVEIIP